MLFNSFEFIFFFLPLTFLLYHILSAHSLIQESKGVLVVASLFFYSWWNIKYLPLILASLFFNYLMGQVLKSKQFKILSSNKSILIFGVSANLSLLGFYKYSDFLIENTNVLINTNAPLLNIALPLGISFFTFQQITYLVDSYKGKVENNNFLNYAVFVSFFPQLIAGPIVHHKEMMPQFENENNKKIIFRNISSGLFIFSIGLFKKVIIADTFAKYVNDRYVGYGDVHILTFFQAWITSLSYTFQLYFDFSGYTDMAIGAALLFNIILPINFNSPYKALDITDFWRRWHITLGRFFRDYVYIPLGGNRVGNRRIYQNLMITFILGGIWHGAGWSFIFWGFLHGFALVIHRLWQRSGLRCNKIVAWVITFNFVNIAWVFFRLNEWNDAVNVLKSMFGFNGIALPGSLEGRFDYLSQLGFIFGGTVYQSIGIWHSPICLIMATLIALVCKNSAELAQEFNENKRSVLFSVVLFNMCLLHLNKASDFLYFDF